MSKTKLDEMRAKLYVDSVSRNNENGIITVRRRFFYTMGRTAADLEQRVRSAFPQATIVDSGDVWKAFSGGASVARSSHWYVRFTLPDDKEQS